MTEEEFLAVAGTEYTTPTQGDIPYGQEFDDPSTVTTIHGDGYYSQNGVLYSPGGNLVEDSLGRPYEVDPYDPTPINQASVDAFYQQGAEDYFAGYDPGTISGSLDLTSPDTGLNVLEAQIETVNQTITNSLTEIKLSLEQQTKDNRISYMIPVIIVILVLIIVTMRKRKDSQISKH